VRNLLSFITTECRAEHQPLTARTPELGITGILNIVWCFVTAIYMLTRKYYSGGIVFLIFGAFAVFCFISWIPRIPFSGIIMPAIIRYKTDKVLMFT